MPRYFFHVRNQVDYTRDTVGVALADLDHARQQAAKSAGEILTSDLAEGRADVAFEIQVEDSNDVRLLTFHIRSTVDPAATSPSATGADTAG